ncbi:hypothetical protein ACWGA9_06210 [Streptomyces sp. NPDC054950]
MLTTHTQRMRPYSVHLSQEEAVELVMEAQIAADLSGDVPELERLANKLGLLLGDSKKERA